MVRRKCFEYLWQKTLDTMFLGEQKIFQLLGCPCLLHFCNGGNNNGDKDGEKWIFIE